MTELPITGTTRFLGLIGDPLSQARSPALVNALLRERDLFGDLLLIPLVVRQGQLAAALSGLRAIESFAGAIITMPHKQAIIPLLDHLGPAASTVGAVNVIRRESDGSLHGDVFDGEGFVAGLRSAGHDIRGWHCLLVGSGGAASAIACALIAHGVGRVDIHNRTAARADMLAQRIRGRWPEADVRPATFEARPYDLVINGTSLGMQDDDQLPIPESIIELAGVVAEIVVSRPITPLLATAKKMDKVTHAGVHMLREQMALLLDFMGAKAATIEGRARPESPPPS